MTRPAATGTRWRRFRDVMVGRDLWTATKPPAGGAPRPIADASFFHPGGRAAVLLIHGLTGTPTEMRFVGKALAQAGFTVYGMQLAGHCGTEADLLCTGQADWWASVEAAFHRLRRDHDTVFAAGLSMGAVLALKLAHAYPDAVRGVALYSTTLEYDGWSIPRLAFLLPLFLHTPLGARYRFVENFPYGIKDTRLRNRVVASMMSGDSAEAGTLGMTGSSLREMLALVAEVKRLMPAIRTPALVLHASDDDVTSAANADYVERRLGGPVHKVLLPDCYHMITVDRQRHEVARQTIGFFAELSGERPRVEDAAE
jgi:carboxylesterase